MPVPVPPPPPAEPARLDRRTRSRLSRGALHIDARLDLHGLTQDAARRRLVRFLDDARADGARLVLVITGKGAPADAGDYVAPVRGVLRRAVPEWLAAPELRHLVAGFDEAGRRHGGGGAIYVRIRRSRGDAG
jgi:DNA-nicking Smr family endonuclease